MILPDWTKMVKGMVARVVVQKEDIIFSKVQRFGFIIIKRVTPTLAKQRREGVSSRHPTARRRTRQMMVFAKSGVVARVYLEAVVFFVVSPLFFLFFCCPFAF